MRNKQPEHVCIEAKIVAKTLKALKVQQGQSCVWVPLSQVHGNPKIGDSEFYATPWVANKTSLVVLT